MKEIAKKTENKGAYFLVIELPEDKTIRIGKLGNFEFKKGYYVYVGSAKRNLFQRIQRHIRKKKKLHWHIDYLVKFAKKITPVTITNSQDLECKMAKELEKISEGIIPGFGCSDCKCKSHLFYFSHNPLEYESFIKCIKYFQSFSLVIDLSTEIPSLFKLIDNNLTCYWFS